MKNFLQANLKTRLTFLILLAFAPAFALFLFASYEQMQEQENVARESALRLVRVMKVSHSQVMDDAKGFLSAMAQFSSPRMKEPLSCDFLTSDLMQNIPGYISFGLIAPNGNVACSTEPAKLKGNVKSLGFFQEAMTRRAVSAGPYEIDETENRPYVFMGAPIFSEDRRIEGVLFTVLDLSRLDRLPAAAQLSPESVIVVFDQLGLVLARYPDRGAWTGTYAIANAPLVNFIRSNSAEEGVVELTGIDRIRRMIAYVRIHRTGSQSVYLSTAVPSDVAFATSKAAFRNNMLILASVSVLVLSIAWIGSHRLVVRKMRSLIDAAQRIRNGDFKARSGLKKSPDEVGQLASAIDAMAQSIQRRVEALQQHSLEMGELKSMNDALQSCMSQEEVLAIVRQFALRLFPGQPGALYLMHPSGDHLEVKTSWANPSAKGEFLPQDCWAVRRGKLYRVDANGNQPRCHHMQDPPPMSYVCVPLMAQGEMLGIFHLESDRREWSEEDAAREESLASAVAEHISMTLANLRLRETLHAQAMRDGLTGLFNRRYMEETLIRETRNALRNKSGIAIIMIDIDHFKRFNDSFGHAAGDALLREVGKMLQRQMRGGDLACRYGGEEFTIILPGTSLRHAVDIAEKLRESAQHLHVDVDGSPVGQVTISLGAASFPEHGKTWQEVLHAADIALLEAKQTRNRVVMFEAGYRDERTHRTGT